MAFPARNQLWNAQTLRAPESLPITPRIEGRGTRPLQFAELLRRGAAFGAFACS